MAFIGIILMYYLAIVLVVVGILLFLVLLFSVLAIVFGRLGRKQENKKKRIASRVFMVLACVSASPILIVVAYIAYSATFTEIPLPNGKQVVVRTSKIEKMVEIAQSTDDNIDKLDKMLERKPNLVYYVDSYSYSILDMGTACGNYEVVETAINHGVPIDDDRIFENGVLDEDGKKMYYTMEIYLMELDDRTVTEDDPKIMGLLLDKNADTDINFYDYEPYSNIFGKVAWYVLTNDDTVTDTETELIQAMLDKGCEKDSKLAAVFENGEEADYSGYNDGVFKDSKYEKLVELITE